MPSSSLLHHSKAGPAGVRRQWRGALLAFVLVFVASGIGTANVAHAAIQTVAVNGSLQTAINNAQPGDVIRLSGNTQLNESVNLASMGSAVGSGPGNLTIVGVNGAGATALSGNGTRLYYNGAAAFPGTLTLDGLTFSTSTSTAAPAVSLANVRNVIVVNSVFDGVGAEGCITGPNGCNGLSVSFQSGSGGVALYNNTFRNIASDAVYIMASGSATASVTALKNVFTDTATSASVPNTGLFVTSLGAATLDASLAQNSFDSLTNAAAYFVAGGTSLLATSVVSNSITNMAGASLGAIDVDSATGAASSPTISAIITDNQLSSLKSSGIVAQHQGASPTSSILVARNRIQSLDTTSNRRGITVTSVPGTTGTVTLDARDNTISNTGGSAIRIDASDASVKTVLRGNTLSANNLLPSSVDAGIFLRSGFGTTTPLTFQGAISGNTIDGAGVKLGEYGSSAMSFETNGPAPDSYMQANNTFSGGGTVSVASGTLGSLSLNTVPQIAEQHPPSAFADSVTASSGNTSVVDVLANDRDADAGDQVNLLSFQPVTRNGAAISRDDNGTPANLADDRLTFTPLSGTSGPDLFYYVVRDNGGRTSLNQVQVNVVTDATPPDTAITAFPPNPSNDATPTFQFSGSDNLTPPASLVFQCRIFLSAAQPPAYGSCASPFTSASLPDGAYTFQVRAFDQAGNGDPSPAQYAWLIDATGPSAAISSGPAAQTNTTSAAFSFSGSDGGSGISRYECGLDGATFATCTSPQPYAGLSDGAHTFQVRAVDAAGNTGSPATYSWLVDTVAPETTITANPSAVTTSTAASFQFAGNALGGSAIAAFECRLDAGAYATCTSPRSLTGLSEGGHTFEVRAVDAAGNVDASPATFTWTIDQSAPDTLITAGPRPNSNSATASFGFSGDDGAGSGVASFECQLDEGAFAPCASPQVYAGLADGAHTFAVRAIDRAGTPDPSPASFSWAIDTSPLTVTVEQAAGQSDPAIAAPLRFAVVFNKPVSDFDATDVDVSGSTAPGALSASVVGSGTTYTVTISGMTGSGVVIASLPAGAATDSFGNSARASTSLDNRITFSPITPVVTGVTRSDASPTRASRVDYRVTFSEGVVGVDKGDFALVTNGVSGATIAGVSGGGTTWTVSVSTGGGSGTLGLNLVDDDSITGAQSGTALGGPGAGNGGLVGEVYLLDRTPPTAALAPTLPVIRGANSYTFTVVFSDNLAVRVADLGAGDIVVTGPGAFRQVAAFARAAPNSDGSPISATYRISAPGGSWDAGDTGDYQVALAAGEVGDTLGNQAGAAPLGRFRASLGATLFLPLVAQPAAPGTAARR